MRFEAGSASAGIEPPSCSTSKHRAAGFAVPLLELDDAPEHCLYRRLTKEQVLDPYGAYNAMLRRRYCFAAAIEVELYRGRPGV